MIKQCLTMAEYRSTTERKTTGMNIGNFTGENCLRYVFSIRHYLYFYIFVSSMLLVSKFCEEGYHFTV